MYSAIPIFGNQFWTFVTRAFTPAQQIEYRLLAAQARVLELRSNAHYLAAGGFLGTWIRQQTESLESNPVKPAFDGYGIRSDWVPPFSAELLGGPSEQTSVEFYLGAAKEK